MLYGKDFVGPSQTCIDFLHFFRFFYFYNFSIHYSLSGNYQKQEILNIFELQIITMPPKMFSLGRYNHKKTDQKKKKRKFQNENEQDQERFLSHSQEWRDAELVRACHRRAMETAERSEERRDADRVRTRHRRAMKTTEQSQEWHESNCIRAQQRRDLQTAEEIETERVTRRGANSVEITRNDILAAMQVCASKTALKQSRFWLYEGLTYDYQLVFV